MVRQRRLPLVAPIHPARNVWALPVNARESLLRAASSALSRGENVGLTMIHLLSVFCLCATGFTWMDEQREPLDVARPN